MSDTYFDFDGDTLQITQRYSESSGYGSPTPVFSPLRPGCSKSREHISEDTGFESSSDRSSLTLSQDGNLNESPGSVSPRDNSRAFHWPLCPRTSLDSLIPLKRYDSKDSVNSTSSFSNFPPEARAVLAKVRDQMRSSLKLVKELQEKAKQIPLLQVKISTLQEEKRQLSNQLKTTIKKNVKKTRSCSLTYDSSYETRSIAVGDHSIHDILCKKCKELQNKLFGLHEKQFDLNQNELFFDRTDRLIPRALHEKSSNRDHYTIQVFQDRYTQTRPKGQNNNSTQTTLEIPTENVQPSTRTFQDRSCGSIITTRSVGVGQMGSFVMDACSGDDKEITTVNDFGVQKTVDVDDKCCGVPKVETRSTGINVSPTLISVGTGYSSVDKPTNLEQPMLSVGSQTTKNAFVSVGVGMSSVDNFDECDGCQSKKGISVEEILESNKFILNSKSVAVNTCSWEELKTNTIRDDATSRSTATKTVGCGKLSVTDSDCLKCVVRSSRSVGVSCKPNVSDVAVWVQDTGISVKAGSSVGVGECCVTDDYCERCFSLHTRTIGVGNGSIFNDDPRSSTPGVSEDEVKDATTVQYNDTRKIAQKKETTLNQDVGDLSGSERMFSDEYERITDGWGFNYEDEKFKRLANPSKEILLACELLQKHFQEEEHLDENKLLVCMKSIEDYWFNCVTESSLDKQFMSQLLSLFKHNLPLLLEGLINSQDENGNTALHYLVTYGKFDCVNELLTTDLCDLNITNKAGYSAVMLGSLKECEDEKSKIVLECLFEKGNLNCIAQSTGQTALMLAAGTGRVDMVRLLLQCGAAKSINTTDLDGSTALMCACEHGYSAIIKHLLAVHGCDATIEDHDGSTCFSIAMEQNRKDIALMIYSHLQLQDTRSTKMKSTGQSQLRIKS